MTTRQGSADLGVAEGVAEGLAGARCSVVCHMVLGVVHGIGEVCPSFQLWQRGYGTSDIPCLIERHSMDGLPRAEVLRMASLPMGDV